MKNTIIFIILAVVVIGGFVWFQKKNPTPENAGDNGESTTMDSGLIIKDVVVGTGKEVLSGNAVSVHYVGTLEDGTKFDSSRDRNQPFVFMVGKGQVIQGWDQGLIGMKVGGKRILTIPPELGYGEAGAGDGLIPGGATLIFEIELLDTATPAEIEAMQIGEGQ